MCVFSGVLLALNSFLWMTMHEHIDALLVDEYLESEDIQPMAFPANSHDLNPIEHAWDALGRAIVMRQFPPQNHFGVKNCSDGRMGGPTTSSP